MERVVGVETEYGLSARTPRGRLSVPEAAELLFAPLVADYRSTNAFLANGGRLYLDVGAHPEYATPECRTARDLIVAERAGDELVAGLAAAATARAEADGRQVRFRLVKNNVDSFGNSYGCHENYSLPRQTDFEALVERLTPFLVSRQLICGSGSYRQGRFQISQRAGQLHEVVSAQSTRTRPLVNSRDEPLADPQRFRRLHVLAGDSNLSEPSAWLKVGSLLAVLAALETASAPQRRRLAAMRLADPTAALRSIAADPWAAVALADGGAITAVDLQQEYLDLAGDQAEPGLAALWQRVLDALRRRAPEEVADQVEWVAKQTLLEEFQRRHTLAEDDPRLAQLDLAFHELGGIFAVLEARGVVARLSTTEEVTIALDSPPSDTRAAVRGAFVAQARARGWDYTVDWQQLTVHASAEVPVEWKLPLPDPLANDASLLEA